ncbi:MAG: hypothetical protein JWQ87_3949 [Candidatus Sulfotelmatobacter sp.]|nr:hypothetical protein [Candidatus Sulfotelmatobacter sp.]
MARLCSREAASMVAFSRARMRSLRHWAAAMVLTSMCSMAVWGWSSTWRRELAPSRREAAICLSIRIGWRFYFAAPEGEFGVRVWVSGLE